ncbi:MAG: hypothetical protein R3C56_28930 [Pirellulaceae bacterium]
MSLASGAFFKRGIVDKQRLGRLSALLFGLAWLTQPVLGQMNLAYTYGWHPISLAIPLMLAALWPTGSTCGSLCSGDLRHVDGGGSHRGGFWSILRLTQRSVCGRCVQGISICPILAQCLGFQCLLG